MLHSFLLPPIDTGLPLECLHFLSYATRLRKSDFGWFCPHMERVLSYPLFWRPAIRSDSDPVNVSARVNAILQPSSKHSSNPTLYSVVNVCTVWLENGDSNVCDGGMGEGNKFMPQSPHSLSRYTLPEGLEEMGFLNEGPTFERFDDEIFLRR